MAEDRANDSKRVPDLDKGKSQIEKVFEVLSRKPDVTGKDE